MEHIELFDRYLENTLANEERAEFKNRLCHDKEFAAEFNVYSAVVWGICQEAEQDNVDFGIAMKHLTKNQLKEIVGPHVVTLRPQNSKSKSWLWQLTSIAAVLIIAITLVVQIDKRGRYNVDNAIVACQNNDILLWRGGFEPINIEALSLNELQTRIPQLEKMYNDAVGDQEIADNGFILAMAHLRLHNRDQVRVILSQLIARFENNEDYQGLVSQYEMILSLVK